MGEDVVEYESVIDTIFDTTITIQDTVSSWVDSAVDAASDFVDSAFTTVEGYSADGTAEAQESYAAAADITAAFESANANAAALNALEGIQAAEFESGMSLSDAYSAFSDAAQEAESGADASAAEAEQIITSLARPSPPAPKPQPRPLPPPLPEEKKQSFTDRLLSSISDAIFVIPNALVEAVSSRVHKRIVRDTILTLANAASPGSYSKSMSEDELRKIFGIEDLPSDLAKNAINIVEGFFAMLTQAAPRDRLVYGIYDRDPIKIPSAPDLIRFELREVFREPDRSIQLVPPASEDFKRFMRAQGFSEFWSDSFWAAHWELPSVQQGYEMFHRLRRGRVPDELVFDRIQLEALMRKQDILPYYIPKLLAISYSPYTRVDVRRMFEAGVLNEKEVYESYRDIGYDEEKARKLTEFTTREKDAEEKAIARADILSAFRLDLLDYDTAKKELERIGYKTEDAVQILSIEIEKKRRMLEKSAKTEERNLSDSEAQFAVREGLLTIADYEKMLKERNFVETATKLKSQLLQKKLASATEVRERELSLSDMERAVALGFISRTEFEVWLREMKFSERAIRIEMRLLEAEIAAKRRPLR